MIGIFLITLFIVGIIVLSVGLMKGEDEGRGPLISGVIILILSLWGGFIISLMNLMSEDSIYEIETNKPIDPELRITVKDSVTIDTVYVYEIKYQKE